MATYAASATSTIGANVHPVSTATARVGTNTSHNCDDPVLIRNECRARIPVMPLLAELLAAIAPPACLACGRALVRAGERLCASCTRALPWLRGGCPGCGLPTHRGRSCPAA